MNIVNFGAEVRTMTSREIAELTGQRHDHVMADIRKMLDELGLDAPEFSGTYRTERGNEYKRLESLGYLEQMQRPSRRGGVKKYWSVTKTGAKYGKNATSDRNQRETQPVWYKATAAAMIQEIKSA